jgi:hypothetical protein
MLSGVLLGGSWITDFDCILFCLPDLDKALTAGVTGQQQMLTYWYIQQSV